MKKHVNIPIFIPHLGCNNACVFCNQRTISGKREFLRESVRADIENALKTSENAEREIAYFGGSFTGIDKDDMLYLLKLANEYIKDGRVCAIRVSTRPDYIDGEILSILKEYGVKTVELGIQSMCDDVLCASKRGHTAATSYKAAELIKKFGFNFIGQMMIGLPNSDIDKEIYTAKEIIKMQADGARVYPTVVFYDTELCDMAKSGEYSPLEFPNAVKRTAAVLGEFYGASIPVIRIGLQSGEELFDSERVYSGDYHSAIGEYAQNEYYYGKICENLDEYIKENGEISGKSVEIYCAKGHTSKIIGQKRINAEKIIKKYGILRLKVIEKHNILCYNVSVKVL